MLRGNLQGSNHGTSRRWYSFRESAKGIKTECKKEVILTIWNTQFSECSKEERKEQARTAEALSRGLSCGFPSSQGSVKAVIHIIAGFLLIAPSHP